MATRNLLLDIDGVILRDRELLQHVKDNCVKYIKYKVPECKEPEKRNDTLYLIYGHTARGLQVGYEVDVSDFNRQVYDKELMEHLGVVLAEPELREELRELNALSQENWQMYLFTNSPWRWATRVAVAIGENVRIKCPGDPSFSPLKPELGAYTVPPSSMNLMIDDSLKNLGAARSFSNWKVALFNQGEPDPCLWCPQVASIHDICTLARSIV